MTELILAEFDMGYDTDGIECPSWMSYKLWNKADWDEFYLESRYYNWSLSIDNGEAPIESYYEVSKEEFFNNLTITTDKDRIQAFQIFYGPEQYNNFQNVYNLIREQLSGEQDYPSGLELKEYDKQFITPEIQQLIDQNQKAYEFDQYIFSVDIGPTDEEVASNSILAKALQDIQEISPVDEELPLPDRIKYMKRYLAEFNQQADIIKSYIKGPYPI